MARIDAFLKLGASQGCSDVHLAVGVPPMLRMNGDLVPIRFRELAAAELEAYVMEILTRNLADRFKGGHDVDFSYVSEDGGRFRVNVFRKDSGVGAVFRTIPAEVPTLDSLALPPIVKRLCDYHQGMILVTGTPPYHRGDHMSVMYQHVQGRARPPIELNPALPQGMSDLIMKCMAVDKEKRFASMDEVGVALERFL